MAGEDAMFGLAGGAWRAHQGSVGLGPLRRLLPLFPGGYQGLNSAALG
jgi:hypothetical protein